MKKPSLAENDKKAVKAEEKFRSSDLKGSINKLNSDFVDLNDYNSAEDLEPKNLVKQDYLSENTGYDLLLNGSGTESDEGEILHGRKQPLYVVDGTSVDFTRKASAGRWGDAEYHTDIDIASLEKESVEILTGEKAVELYGESGKNGVILITTKNGAKREIGYIRSSGDTTYTREDAAAMGMMDLINKQKKERKNNQ